MDSGTARRLVVLTGRYDTDTVIEDVEAVAAAFPGWRILIVQESAPPGGRAAPLRERAALGRRPVSRAPRPGGSRVGLPAALSEVRSPNLEYVRCDRLHDAATLERIRAWRPWLGLAIAAPILEPALCAMPEAGTIELCRSLPQSEAARPEGRASPEGAATTCVTVRRIAEGNEAGTLILGEPIPIPPYATPLGLAHLLDVEGTRTLIRALRRLDREFVPGRPSGERSAPGEARPHEGVPVRSERAQRRRSGRSVPMRAAKELASAAYLSLVAAPRNILRRARARSATTVLLYHRVSDDFLDGVTVGVEQFDRQLAMLKRHYDVVDPETLLEAPPRRAGRRRIVITFDDGYRDNYLAARLLRRHGLSAAFFVSTRIVGTERGFPHDRARLDRAVPALDWDAIREMAAWGFPIGNHTADHVNLGDVPLEEAESQIVTATRDLEEQCPGSPAARWLAYPYGTRQAMTDALRARLPALGIELCCSAYGGRNGSPPDRWNILRQGVDHGVTERRLRAAIEGWGIGTGGE